MQEGNLNFHLRPYTQSSYHMNDKNLKITIYCASSSEIHQNYFDHAKELGKLLSQINCVVTYGGGATGLMGILADSMLEAWWQYPRPNPSIYDRKRMAAPRCTRHESSLHHA